MNAVRLDPQGPFKRDPLAPHQMRDRMTRTQDVIVLCHLGVPRIERDRWSLTIDGMVERPCRLQFDDLVHYPKTEVTSVHQCCGSPLDRSSLRDAFATSGGVASGLSTCWLIVGQARPLSTFGLTARIPVNSAALSSMPT
jgi:hypothetical protein